MTLPPSHISDRAELLLSPDGDPSTAIEGSKSVQDDTVDVFLGTYVLDLLSEDGVAEVLRLAGRILRPGGQLCLTGESSSLIHIIGHPAAGATGTAKDEQTAEISPSACCCVSGMLQASHMGQGWGRWQPLPPLPGRQCIFWLRKWSVDAGHKGWMIILVHCGRSNRVQSSLVVR